MKVLGLLWFRLSKGSRDSVFLKTVRLFRLSLSKGSRDLSFLKTLRLFRFLFLRTVEV